MDLKKKELFIFDLDGVIYLGNKLVPGAKEVIEKLVEQKKIIYFVTNNATQTRSIFYEKLCNLKILAQEKHIITSAFATAQYLKQRAPGAIVFIIGEAGLINEFKAAGFQIVSLDQSAATVEFVIVGLDRTFNYQKLAFALTALSKGAEFIATNTDHVLPAEEGILPGAGSIVSALCTAAGREPAIVIGKPNPFMVDLILKLEQVKSSKAVIIGDRYSTDIQAGLKAHIGTILVKTGIGEQELQQIPPSGPKPDLILNSIADMLNFLN